MRAIMFVLILIVGGVLVVGFYRGWFRLASEGTDGQHRITLTVDEDKIKADKKRAQEQLPAMGQVTPAEPGKN